MSDNNSVFKTVRFEPRMLSSDPNCVCEVVCGVTLTEDQHSSYIDGIWKPAEGEMLMLSDLTSEKASQNISQFGSDCGWWDSLRNQIAAQKLQPVNPENYEAPEIILNTELPPVELEEPVIPEPEPTPEPVVEDVDEEEDTSEE